MMQTRRLSSVAVLAATLATALAAILFAPTCALAQSGTYVFDESDLLTAGEFDELEQLGAQYAKRYEMGVYLLICPTMDGGDGSSSGRNEFAQSYYYGHDLGVGAGKGDGILFVVANLTRKYVSFKHIEPGHADPFSTDGVKDMESKAKSYLADDEWGDAAESYYQTVGSQLDYYAQNGRAWHKPNTVGFVLKVAFSLALPAMIALAVVVTQRNAMKTARMQRDAASYTSSADLRLSVARDHFLTSTTTVTPKPREHDSGGGGGGWSDMGGGDFGSGGGSF